LKPVIGNFTSNRLTDNRITTLVRSHTGSNYFISHHILQT